MGKTNCWQAKKCGRQPGGANVAQLGVCKAAADVAFNQVHGGTNAGRACWIVAGTLCGGNVQGSFAQKMVNCMDCQFYTQVKKEEGKGFQASGNLLRLV
jgi:hypothetical protein